MGADKVLLRSSDNREVSSILRWNREVVVRERGAWVRIYGVPLHAWNFNFSNFV